MNNEENASVSEVKLLDSFMQCQLGNTSTQAIRVKWHELRVNINGNSCRNSNKKKTKNNNQSNILKFYL